MEEQSHTSVVTQNSRTTIVLLGTSHVSAQSKREVKQAILHADVVAIELDANRAAGLMSGQRASFSDMRKALGLRTAVIASILRSVQERVAASVDVTPGIEMKAALEEAHKQNKPVALIDRDVRITLQRLSKNVGWPEFKQTVKDLFKRRKINLHPSEDLVSQLIEEMRHTYPRVYKVMVAERDSYMANQLLLVAREHPGKRIVAVVGMGHVSGMKHLINYINAELDVEIWSSPAPSIVPSSRSA